MKLSVSTAVYGMTDLQKIINRVAELGYDGVELTTALHLPVGSTAERRKEVKGWIRNAGIECSTLHYIFDGTIRLLNPDPEEMKKSLAYMKKVIDLSADMECPTVIVGSGGKTRNFEPEWDRKTAIQCMVETIRASGEYAAGKGVVLAMEAINRYETQFLNTMQEATEFAQMVDLPNVRTMADTYHMNIEEKDIGESVRKYGPMLANLHFADSNRQAPGEGHFDFKTLAAALKEINYSHWCSFEVFGLYPWKLWFDTFEEADAQMARGLKFTRALFE